MNMATGIYKTITFTKTIYHFNRSSGYPAHTRMKLSFDGRGMHSHIKAFQQQDQEEDVAAVEGETLNPYVSFVFRPKVVIPKFRRCKQHTVCC